MISLIITRDNHIREIISYEDEDELYLNLSEVVSSLIGLTTITDLSKLDISMINSILDYQNYQDRLHIIPNFNRSELDDDSVMLVYSSKGFNIFKVDNLLDSLKSKLPELLGIDKDLVSYLFSISPTYRRSPEVILDILTKYYDLKYITL